MAGASIGGDPSFDAINVVQNWPGGTDPKVPSLYRYYESAERNWGFGIDDKPGVIRHTKLELQQPTRLRALEKLKNFLQENELQTESVRVATHIMKTPGETLVDYLTEVATCVYNDMGRRRLSDVLKIAAIELIITHPGKWDYRAKNLTFRAASEAFKRAMPAYPDRRWSYRLASEPEACALYTKTVSRDEIESLRVGDCFVVVDAGGGTVDLISFKIESVAPNFRMSMATDVSSGQCGAACIDDYFLKTFLPNKLGDQEYQKLLNMEPSSARANTGGSHTILSAGEQFMLQKFQAIKQGFSGPAANEDAIPLPRNVGDVDDEERNIRNGQLFLTSDDLEQMFRFSVETTLDLIRQQLGQLLKKRLQVQTIFLSGGFSRSDYLYKCVKEVADGHQLKLLRGDDSWTAVARGAVLMGLQLGCEPPPACKECPLNIGVVLAQRFLDHRHSADKKYTDSFDGIDRARDRVKWIVRKGDLIQMDSQLEASETLVIKMSQPGHRPGWLVIILDSGNRRGGLSSSLSECESPEEVRLDYNFGEFSQDKTALLWKPETTPDGAKKYYSLELTLHVRMVGLTIEARLLGPDGTKLARLEPRHL